MLGVLGRTVTRWVHSVAGATLDVQADTVPRVRTISAYAGGSTMPGVAGDPSEVPDRHMDEPRPESIAEESERLVATWRAERPQPAASPKEVEPTHSYWNAPPPEPAPTGRRIGWLVVGIGAAGMVIFADFLAFSGPPSDPNDPSVADVAFFVSPIIAVIAAMATAAMLWVVGALRLADLSAYRARNALVAGALVGPITYLAVLLATTPTLDSAQSGRLDDFVSFVVPVICGLTRIHRWPDLIRLPGHANRCPSELGRWRCEQPIDPNRGAPDRCDHRTASTASMWPSTMTAWSPMRGSSCRPPWLTIWACASW